MAKAAERMFVNICSVYVCVCMHVIMFALVFVSLCMCVCMCIDYSDEIAAGVYEQFQTQLLIEEAMRGSDCKSKLNLQLYCSYSFIQSHITILKEIIF